jgi:hypothetical protein
VVWMVTGNISFMIFWLSNVWCLSFYGVAWNSGDIRNISPSGVAEEKCVCLKEGSGYYLLECVTINFQLFYSRIVFEFD